MPNSRRGLRPPPETYQGSRYFGWIGSVGDRPGGGRTGILSGFGTGRLTRMAASPLGGGVITPSDFPSLSLSVWPIEPVVRGGAIFSGGTVLGSGMLGSRGGAGVCATAAASIMPPSAATRPIVAVGFQGRMTRLLLRGATTSFCEGSGRRAVRVRRSD